MEHPGTRCLLPEVARLMQRAESAITALDSISREDKRSLALNLLAGNVHGQGPNIITALDSGRTFTG